MADSIRTRAQPKKRRFGLALLVALPAIAVVSARTGRCTDTVTSNGDAKFPTVRAKTLSGKCVTFPDATRGKVGVIFVAFEQAAQSDIDSWVTPMISGYLNEADVSYYEIPMISGNYKPVARLIDGGMRGGVPQSLHARTATFYGERSPFFSSMKIADRKRAYMFVLSRSGDIVFRSSGPATPDAVVKAKAAIEAERSKAG
jgi:hypothetical protein